MGREGGKNEPESEGESRLHRTLCEILLLDFEVANGHDIVRDDSLERA